MEEETDANNNTSGSGILKRQAPSRTDEEPSDDDLNGDDTLTISKRVRFELPQMEALEPQVSVQTIEEIPQAPLAAASTATLTDEGKLPLSAERILKVQ